MHLVKFLRKEVKILSLSRENQDMEQQNKAVDSTQWQRTLANLRAYKAEKVIKNRTASIGVAGVIIVFLFSLPILRNNDRFEAYKDDYQIAADQLVEMKERQAELEYQVNLLEDEEFVSKLVRDQFNMSQENEIIFRFPAEEQKEKEAYQSSKDANTLNNSDIDEDNQEPTEDQENQTENTENE